MFFERKAFGLNISDYSIEVISLGGSIKEPKLLALGRAILEPGIVGDGKILQKERLEAVLQKLTGKPKFGKIKTKKCIFALPESKIFIHFFQLPNVSEKEKIEKEIEFQAIHHFPFPLKELYFDFQIHNKEILLVAAPRDIVDDYLEVFKNLRLRSLALEVESISISRACTRESKEVILIADIGARTTSLSIFTPLKPLTGSLRLSISTNIAGDKFSRALSEKLNISFKEAESLKKEIGLDPEKKEGKVFLVLQGEVRGIIAEIEKIENYFRKKTGRKIDRLILTGGSAALPRLVEYLEENLEKPVSIGDPWKKINIDILRKKEYFENALEINPILYATALGSALRGLEKSPEKNDINLLKNIKNKSRKQNL